MSSQEVKNKNFELRDWRISKYPLRMIIRSIFLTYMWSDMRPGNKPENTPDAKGFEYLTMIGFIGTTFTLFLSAIQEYFPDLKGFKVGINGLFLVVEVLITVLYWGLYFIGTKLIHDEDRWTETGHVPPIFMDTAAHLIPVIAMSTEFLFSRTSKRNLYENRIVHLFAVVIFTFGYFVWILYLFNETQHFPYPFLRMISAPARVAFTVFSSVLGVFVYGVITYAYSKYHATEGDLPVLAEEFYDETDEDEE